MNIRFALVFATFVLLPAFGIGSDIERAPISYSETAPENRVSRLNDAVRAGEISLTHDGSLSYLRSLLKELDVPESSQTLVFSKTSLQRSRISSETPRALYFNDDTYVGYCQYGDVIEISTADDRLGAVFYTLDQSETKAPLLVRQTDNCMTCHASSLTNDVPGHMARSVYAGPTGMPLLAWGTHRVDQTTPIEKRWGGWYVTGKHGEQKHLGNLIVRERARSPEEIDNSAGQNITDLKPFFDTAKYLTPHSDIVALMVLEHQLDAHNAITQANFGVRQALHHEETLNRELKKPLDERWESTTSRIENSCEPLIEQIFFFDEAPLTAKLEGTSGFAEELQQRGPFDSKGRSLRDLDMTRRMFKYPLSYLVYSSSFAALPAEAKEYVFSRMDEILDGRDPKFAHLNAEDRAAIREILADTLPEFARR